MQQATHKFSIQAGLLHRGTVKRELERVCFENDVECDIKENRGWLESDLLVTLKGEKGIVERVARGVANWLADPYE